ncbi:hypothetical protein GPALN_004835 [Globodera pallida]|nr:hypothetical protein GPALN_004835 [Globodera pallida]
MLAMDGANVKYESVVEDLINFKATVSEIRNRVNVGDAETNSIPRNNPHRNRNCRKCNGFGHRERMCEPHQASLQRHGDRKNQIPTNTVRFGGVKLVNSINHTHNMIAAQ